MAVFAVTALGACGADPPAKAPSGQRPYSPTKAPGTSIPFPPPRHLHPPN